MAVAVAHDPHEQATRRMRARLSQQAVGDQFSTPISDTAVSDYERGNKPLPFRFTGDDYEVAMAKAIVARDEQRKRGRK